MSKQTAVEWLTQRLHNRRNGIYDGHPDLSVQQLCEIALVMEREQIEEAYNHGQQIPPFEFAEQYFEQTYGKEASDEEHS